METRFDPRTVPDYTKPLMTDMCPMCHRVNMKGLTHSKRDCIRFIRENIESYQRNLTMVKDTD